MAAITAILTDYAPETVRLVTDPRTGIATQEKFQIWMPNPGELKAACDEIEAPARRAKERERADQQFARENALLDGHREGRLTLNELKAKYGKNWGLGTGEEAPQVKKERAFKRFSDDEIRSLYPEGRNGWT